MSAVIIAALMFASCKPTENNYKAAYDAALEKREAVSREQMLPATGLLSDDGPQMKILEGDTIFVLKELLYRGEPAQKVAGWKVAVSLYKMETNASANATDLQNSGWKNAFAAHAKGEKWYVVVDKTSTLDSARVIAKEFIKKHKNYPYIGLPSSPVLIN